MPELEPTERNQTADLLKGIAVVLMIEVHLVEQFATLDLFGSAIGRISLFLGGPPAAPVFLAVMGFFLARSPRSAASLAKRGALLVVGGILLNLGLNANLLYAIHQGRFDLDPLAFVFGADILPAAGLSIILIAIARTYARARVLPYILAACSIAGVTPLLSTIAADPSSNAIHYALPFLFGNSWWSYFPLFPWFAYPLLGVAFANASGLRSRFLSLHTTYRWLTVGAVAAMLLVTVPYALANITELHRYYHHDIRLMIWISGFLFVWLMMVMNAEQLFGTSAAFRYLKWLGRNVTSAFVFQWLLIGNIATEIYRTQDLKQLALWFIGIMAATTLLTYAFQAMRRTSERTRELKDHANAE